VHIFYQAQWFYLVSTDGRIINNRSGRAAHWPGLSGRTKKQIQSAAAKLPSYAQCPIYNP
jgi:hypothetical protein